MRESMEMLRYIEKLHAKIKRFCAPLVDHFSVNEFCHQKETVDRRSKSISLNQDYLNYYYPERIYLLNPLSIAPKHHSARLIFLNDVQDISTKILVNDAKNKFGIHLSFILCDSVSDGMEFFSFGLTSSEAA